MVIEITEATLGGLRLTREEALLDLAVGLYTDGRVTPGKAAQIAGVPQADFQQELGRRGITVHYNVQDLQDDLRTLQSLRKQ